MLQQPLHRREFWGRSIAALTGLGLASRALADVPARWAAIAHSPSQGRNWAVSDHGSRREAEADALDKLGARDGRVLLAGSGTWLATATHKGGTGYASGDTLFQATDTAHEKCKEYTGDRGTIAICVYGSATGVDFPISFGDGFTGDQRQLLSNAVWFARWLFPSVVRRVNEIARDPYLHPKLADQYFIRGYEQTPDRTRALMGVQAIYLATYHHPGLELTAYREEVNYAARARPGLVVAPYGTNEKGDIKGSFKVEVNLHQLPAKWDRDAALGWAGVMVHELMHNLGHMHGNDEYGDHLQINAIQHLVRTQGAYLKNDRCPPFACDCRRAWR